MVGTNVFVYLVETFHDEKPGMKGNTSWWLESNTWQVASTLFTIHLVGPPTVRLSDNLSEKSTTLECFFCKAVHLHDFSG